jgi:hypothetical protein
MLIANNKVWDHKALAHTDHTKPRCAFAHIITTQNRKECRRALSFAPSLPLSSHVGQALLDACASTHLCANQTRLNNTAVSVR